jgi:hypothetical protein
MMKKDSFIKHSITIVMLCFSNFIFAQNVIYVPNKSLEDTILISDGNKAPFGWNICNLTPEVILNNQIGGLHGLPNPTSGIYYVLLEGLTSFNAYEKIAVRLLNHMPQSHHYIMFIDLREFLDQSLQDAVAEIYGGTYLCDTTYKLWTSPSLDSSKWTRFKATFTAPVDIDYLILSGRNEFPQDFQGAALIDNLSDIYDSATYVGMDEAQIKAAVAAEQGQLQLSPNPATNQLRITNEAFQIEELEIYDVMGQSQFVAPLRFDKLKAEQIELDVSKLNAGIYFIKAIDKSSSPWRIKTGKFAKN